MPEYEVTIAEIKKDTEVIVREIKEMREFQKSCSAKQDTRFGNMKDDHSELQQANLKQNGESAVMKRDIETAHQRIDGKAGKVMEKLIWVLISGILGIAYFILKGELR